MKSILLASLFMASVATFAANKKREVASTVPTVVRQAASKMATGDTRVNITQVNNVDGNPCIPEGISYNVDLQVKKASWNALKSKVDYAWETVKTINVSEKGEVSEVCAE